MVKNNQTVETNQMVKSNQMAETSQMVKNNQTAETNQMVEKERSMVLLALKSVTALHLNSNVGWNAINV